MAVFILKKHHQIVAGCNQRIEFHFYFIKEQYLLAWIFCTHVIIHRALIRITFDREQQKKMSKNLLRRAGGQSGDGVLVLHDIRLQLPEHLYFVGDRRVPGFSEIKADLGFPGNRFWTEDGRSQGTALHGWFNVLARGLKPVNKPHANIAGRVEGIKKFLSDTRFKIIDGEKPVYCPSLDFAVSPDAWGVLDGSDCVLEVKRGAVEASHAAQTAAQLLALLENDFLATKRFALYLKDGDYKLEQHTNKDDVKNWKYCVGAYHAKRAWA